GIYGGVVRDFTETGRLLEDTPGSAASPVKRMGDVALAASFYTLDLPLSLVADTVTLPVTIPVSLTRQDRPDTKASYKDAYSPSKMPVLIPDVDTSSSADGETSPGAHATEK